MNRAQKRTNARDRREKQHRSRMAVHLLIIVVALIECLVLLSFTTYSWIESSSSLIISSGKNGIENMSVAKNINYQVLFSFSSEENVDLSHDSEDGGYYRTVENFSYAKATTPDGETFFFKRPANLGLTGADAYRRGDTADYNTAYTYLDFELKNTTGTSKGFFFEPDTHTSIFSISNRSSLANIDEVVYGEKTAEQVIIGAMRISFTKNNGTPQVFSVGGNTSTSPVNTSGAASETDLSSYTIESHEYDDSGLLGHSAVFESLSTDLTSKISIRVWFDENDSAYRTLTNKKALVDEILYGAELQMNFRLVNDTVPYSLIYFDDYAFSETKAGKFVTEENSTYSMYFHAYNSKSGTYVNYPMSIEENEHSDAVRWSTSIPIPYVVENLLDSTEREKFGEAYFFYGSVSGSAATPAKVAYKWSLPGALNAVDTIDDSEDVKDTITNNVFRNLGVVRTAGNYTRAYVADYVLGTTAEPVNGFLQFETGTYDMTLVYFRDRATVLTGENYNVGGGFTTDTYGNVTGGYITSSRSEASLDLLVAIDYSKLHYYDVPESADEIIFSTGSGGGTDQTVSINTFSDGECFHLVSDNGTNRTVEEVAASLPTAVSRGLLGVKRIYFMDDHATVHWTAPKLYFQSDEIACSFPGEAMTAFDAPSATRQIDRVYINQTSNAVDGTNANQAAVAKETVLMRYNSTSKLWSAYVPSSWLTTAGTYFHYNGKDSYYNDYNENFRFAAGVASQYNGSDYIYTALGYTNAASVASVTRGTGVGTWDDVRQISFATELIDSSITAAAVYKVGTGSGQYAMAPVDSMRMTYMAYVPVTGLSAQSTSHALRYTRYAAYDSSTVTGYWYPQENITSSEIVYYAVDSAAASDSNTAARGWYHVAVFVDGTYENLIYDTTLGTESATSHGALSYKLSSAASYTAIADSYNSVNDYLLSGDHTRWAVPIGSATYLYFKWEPYSGTVFEYEFDVSDGIYFVVTEASGISVES